MSGGFSCIEPVLSKLMCFAQGHNLVTPVRLKPATPQSLVDHSTTALPIMNDFNLSTLKIANTGELTSLSVRSHISALTSTLVSYY